MTPLEAILGFFPMLGQAEVSAKKLEKLGLLLETEGGEIQEQAEPARGSRLSRLQLSGVTHSYFNECDADTFLLGPLDLTFNPGELVFIVGGNGSGKTTLAKLLAGLYTPESGEIRLNDEAITDNTREAYRQQFSVIFSDFYLFENLAGSPDDVADFQVQSYLEQLQLRRRVQISDGVFSTTALSQGQRKRLALLNTYIEDRAVCIFDEWAADQEPHFKEVFYSDILPRLKARGKLVLVITHDDRYYGMADRVIKLDYGKVEYDRELAGERARAKT
jgi:putative ATP-binding cassette transporter